MKVLIIIVMLSLVTKKLPTAREIYRVKKCCFFKGYENENLTPPIKLLPGIGLRSMIL